MSCRHGSSTFTYPEKQDRKQHDQHNGKCHHGLKRSLSCGEFERITFKSCCCSFLFALIDPTANEGLPDRCREHTESTHNRHTNRTAKRNFFGNEPDHIGPEITNTHCKEYGSDIRHCSRLCAK